MPIIGIQGIRGGTGTTSVTAGLAWALQTLKESVLVIDFSPENMLRLHFNMPFTMPRGWIRSIIDGKPWQESAMRYTPLLDFLPFGITSRSEIVKFEEHLKFKYQLWQKNMHSYLNKLRAHYEWILLDLPTGTNLYADLGLYLSDHLFLLLNPDVSCHVRIHQQELPKECSLLLNKFRPNSVLQKDLHKLWQNTIPNFLPLLIHFDEGLAEALASKQPVGEYAPENLSTHELTTLANWCLLRLTQSKS